MSSETLAKRNEMVRTHWGAMPTLAEVRAYFAHHLGMPPLKPLKKPCHDCAVTCGFYTPMAAGLSLLTPAEIEHHSARWFCHNANRACAGNIEYQRALQESRTCGDT
jgi:hypothetical protein